MIRYFILYLLCLPLIASAQQDIYLFIDSTTIIGKISNNKLSDGPDHIAYTIQGNMIYTGDTITKSGMLFAINAKDMLHNKTGLVLQPDRKAVQYICMQNAFYLGDHPIDKETELLLTLTVVNDSVVEVYSRGGRFIGVIEGKELTQPQIALSAHMYIRHFALDDSVHVDNLRVTAGAEGQTGGIIHPEYDRGPYFEWVWDGTTLKPAYGYRPEDEWSFDGKYLKPEWSADPELEWIWDGTIMKKSWDNGTANQWIWRDGVLKPFWDSDPDRQWILEDGIMRPMWRFNTLENWVVEGDVPLPVLTIVVLGISDR